jgi:hypothetical protein
MSDILLADLAATNLSPALRHLQAVRADALNRCLRYQGDDSHLLLIGARELRLDLHAVTAQHLDPPAAVAATPPGGTRRQEATLAVLRANVALCGDLEWWGHGPPQAGLEAGAIARCRAVVARLQALLSGQGPFVRAGWRLAIQAEDWPHWQAALATIADEGWLPPRSIHCLPRLAVDAHSACCPRCGALSEGAPEAERRRLCALPERLRVSGLGEREPLRQALPLTFISAVHRFDTVSALRCLDEQQRALAEWLHLTGRQRLSDEEWEARALTHLRRQQALADWLQILLPIPVEAPSVTEVAQLGTGH